MRCKTQTVPILFVALFLVISIAIVGYSVSANEMTDDAEFRLVENTWSVEPKFVEVGENVTIKGQVENIGDEKENDYVDLYVEDFDGDPIEYRNLVLEPNEKETISFEFGATYETGIYDVRVELPNFEDRWESQFEVKEEIVDNIEISPEDEQTIEAGETIDFSAEAYNQDGDRMSHTDENFTWNNAGDDGLFDQTDAGDYEIWAELDDVKSETILVTVEPADAYQIVFINRPNDDTIEAGESAEFTVEVRDEYDNVNEEGMYRVALKVDGKEISTETIQEDESRATLTWRTTREIDEYNIQAVEKEGLLNSDEVTLTVTEKEDSSMAVQWWAFPLAISVIAVISLIYLWDADKIYFSLGKKTNPTTHEWKKNKGPNEASKETEKEEFDVPDEDVKRGLD